MLPKQNEYKVGIYMRLSQEDMREGESLSIENQRRVLTNHVNEQGWEIYDEYVDDGISGVSFDRPGVKRLLDNAKSGKYKCTYCAYGYFKGDDGFNTPVIDPYAAAVVRRIFEMRAKGFNPKKIADILNSEHIATPSDYQYQRIGKPNPHNTSHLWGNINVKRILKNPIYIGNLAQQRTTSVSYKNHKIIQKKEENWVVVENNHEPIISRELWDKCREIDKSVSRGKRDKKDSTAPLSGFLYCDSCGENQGTA